MQFHTELDFTGSLWFPWLLTQEQSLHGIQWNLEIVYKIQFWEQGHKYSIRENYRFYDIKKRNSNGTELNRKMNIK